MKLDTLLQRAAAAATPGAGAAKPATWMAGVGAVFAAAMQVSTLVSDIQHEVDAAHGFREQTEHNLHQIYRGQRMLTAKVNVLLRREIAKGQRKPMTIGAELDIAQAMERHALQDDGYDGGGPMDDLPASPINLRAPTALLQ